MAVYMIEINKVNYSDSKWAVLWLLKDMDKFAPFGKDIHS
jgi:hypothetical protein